MRLAGHERIIEDSPSPSEQRAFLEQGFELDDRGRPVHPWASTRLINESLVPGKGTFYRWGPNKTVDPIVLTTEHEPRILLIRRHDTGQWALPGGFVDIDESALIAAERELHEETSLQLSKPVWQTCYSGPVDDPRITLNAWPETTALITQVTLAQKPMASDDALHAEWVPLADVQSMELYGSHKQLICLGLALLSH